MDATSFSHLVLKETHGHITCSHHKSKVGGQMHCILHTIFFYLVSPSVSESVSQSVS